MKITALLVLLTTLMSCSSMRLVESWKNEDVTSFTPQKALVLGVTENLTARKIFESKLSIELKKRAINAFESSNYFDVSFTESEKTQAEINAMVEQVRDNGFDAILITAVKGVDQKTRRHDGYYTVDYQWRRFGRYYFRFQDIYYNPGYYSEYKTYHVETSIYNVNEDDQKSLVWVGASDIVDPSDISETVNTYVRRIIRALEKDGLISTIR